MTVLEIHTSEKQLLCDLIDWLNDYVPVNGADTKIVLRPDGFGAEFHVEDLTDNDD